MPVNPITDPYVLEGRIVTMGPQGIVKDGAIYIKDGRIEAVQSAGTPAPAGFTNAHRLRTGDTIYPGLIELHNHLSYNAIPLWDVPQKYANNGQWRGTDGYQREITKPAQVLGGTPGVVESLVRFVEMRALLGGVTTTQGISLSSEPGIKRYYKGLVRNVEQPMYAELPAADTNIGNPVSGKAAEYLAKLKKSKCYLQHLSEGVDDVARGWFLRLKMDNGNWAVNEAFCGIHSTALCEADLRIIAESGGSMIWSPLSNYLLYGATVDLQAARNAGIKIGLGSDWAPSGSKNLLGELKVAWLASEEQGSIFSAEELAAMVTINPAQIARWDAHLGSIEAGKRADLVAIDGQGNDYMRLIEARETSVTLVLIDGIPRVGQPRLMDDFGPGTETIKVGRSDRVLNLAQEAADPLVGALTLTEAVMRLEAAMVNLPKLASDMDSAFSNNLYTGSTDSTGSVWRIAFDFIEDEAISNLALGIAAQPLAAYVTQPMALEKITVIDDPVHFKKLVASRNLPEFIRKGLPPLYGKRIPLPLSGEFLEKTKEILAPEVLETTRDLATFLRMSGELTLAGRKRIVEQAMVVIGENYVHLPLKRAMHAVDPLQRLRLLKYQLNEAIEGELPPEIEFHNELSRIFNSLHDLHTAYRLPYPYEGKVAWLPFLVEEISEHGAQKYIVSKLVADAGPDTFQPGVVITHWNGAPVKQIILNNAEQHAGSNSAARWARGINTLTIRPLGRGLPPQEEWVTLRYTDNDGNTQEWTQEWYIFEPGISANRVAFETLSKEATAVGFDDLTDDIQQTRKVLFAPNVPAAETAGLTPAMAARRLTKGSADITTLLPGIFRARTIEHNGKAYGYIRIFTFNVNDADMFVNEFVRLAEQLPDTGLIIDVRGNGGGLIYAAEQLLQVLTPQHIEPERAQFINSPLNLALCRNHQRSSRYPGLVLEPWLRSMKQSVQTGATFSLAYPITPEEKCNEIGQRYFGPVVLIVDPLCYSATDIFSAGFRDHQIGPILGTGANTGAGGANVWSHHLLSQLMIPDQMAETASPYKPLPHGADIRVAIRRMMRVGENEGDIIEDLGIVPDSVHRMTRGDVLQDNNDLKAKAISMIAGAKRCKLDIKIRERDDALPILEFTTTNVDRIDATIGSVQLRSLYPSAGKSRIDLQQELSEMEMETVEVDIRGYSANRLVVRYRKQIALAVV
ncbi:MAG: amidohydrolase family protein [Gammaproteobacteria bacterium]|nr:amidohydrolase family protein [Gammaproteobacteria bacterium]